MIPLPIPRCNKYIRPIDKSVLGTGSHVGLLGPGDPDMGSSSGCIYIYALPSSFDRCIYHHLRCIQTILGHKWLRTTTIVPELSILFLLCFVFDNSFLLRILASGRKKNGRRKVHFQRQKVVTMWNDCSCDWWNQRHRVGWLVT